MLTSAGVSGIVWPLVAASALLLLILVGVIIRKRRLSHNRQLSGATNLGEAPEQSSSEDEVEQTNTAPASPPPTRTLTPDDIRTINARVRAVLADRFKGPPEVSELSEDLPISVAEFEGMVVGNGAAFSTGAFHKVNGETEDFKESKWTLPSAPAVCAPPGVCALRFRKKIPFVGPFKKWADLAMDITCVETVAGGGEICAFTIATSVSGVPYSDAFRVHEAWICLPTPQPHSCTLQTLLSVEFIKSSPFASMIESTSHADAKTARVLWRQLAGPHMAHIVKRRNAASRRARSTSSGIPGGTLAAPSISTQPRTPTNSRRRTDTGVLPSPASTRVHCPCCDINCRLSAQCKRCIETYEESVMYPSPAADGRPYYTPCTSIGGCVACGCNPLCTFCGCRCGLCGQFGSAGACMTIGCVSCKCKPVCGTCGCQCGLCGNKGKLAACGTVGCASCSCSPAWAPWGKKFTSVSERVKKGKRD